MKVYMLQNDSGQWYKRAHHWGDDSWTNDPQESEVWASTEGPQEARDRLRKKRQWANWYGSGEVKHETTVREFDLDIE